jgi:tRNA U34 5-methylaminomethyl-2-thiouridine-forming methyltransferase MnmC
MQIKKTDDGSETIWSATFQETYHSTFGAKTESIHVFIEAGLNQLNSTSMNIFEVGFGTGLNALLTYQEALAKNIDICYHAIELYPVSLEIIEQFHVEPGFKIPFQKMHEAAWNQEIAISQNFRLKKIQADFIHWQPETLYNLVYFDAFSPETQPDLWTPAIFEKIFNMLHNYSILTTYCAKGYVRRNLIAAGFKVERLPGPPGKREILRATKDLPDISYNRTY